MTTKTLCDRCGEEFNRRTSGAYRTDGKFIVGVYAKAHHVGARPRDVEYPVDLCSRCEVDIWTNGTPYDAVD